jgi:hypothetical protein
LKDELWNDNYHRTFANQAITQDVSNIFNASCLPMFTLTPAKDAFRCGKTMFLKNKMSPGLKMTKELITALVLSS